MQYVKQRNYTRLKYLSRIHNLVFVNAICSMASMSTRKNFQLCLQ